MGFSKVVAFNAYFGEWFTFGATLYGFARALALLLNSYIDASKTPCKNGPEYR